MKHLSLLMGLGGMKIPQGHHTPARVPEEASSCECPHHGQNGASAQVPRLQLRLEKDCILGGHIKAGIQGNLLSQNKREGSRGEFF